MREIKFRFWMKDFELDGTSNMLYQDDKTGCDFYVGPNFLFTRSEDYFEKNKYEIMQYTGVKDKNGKDIYEGDILKSYKTAGLFVIEWCEFEKGFRVVRFTNTESDYEPSFSTFEVIGNIYENPELMEAK